MGGYLCSRGQKCAGGKIGNNGDWLGGGTLCPCMGHVMHSINEITWTGTLFTIAYNHWVRLFSFPGSTPVCGVFFSGRTWVIICTRSS